MIAMTDPTREAFEAWANANGIFDETARAFARDTWQAALAQQGRGVEADTLRTARSAAYRNRFDHAYLPQTSEAAAIWAPHEWVIEAMEAHARNCHAARLAAAPKQQAVDVDGLRSALKQAAADLKAYGHLAAAGRALAALTQTEVDRG